MMSVLEYANELGIDTSKVLKKCSSLGINVNNENDILSEDDVIILDNEFSSVETDDNSLLSEDLQEKYDLEGNIENKTLEPSSGGTGIRLKIPKPTFIKAITPNRL